MELAYKGHMVAVSGVPHIVAILGAYDIPLGLYARHVDGSLTESSQGGAGALVLTDILYHLVVVVIIE